MQFVSMDLDDIVAAQLLLDARAEALQTLYFQPGSLLRSCEGFLEVDSAMSELAGTGLGRSSISPALRSLGVHTSTKVQEFTRTLQEILPTTTSPVSPGAVVVSAHWPRRGFSHVLHETKNQGVSSDIPFGYNRVSRPGICESQGSRYNGRR